MRRLELQLEKKDSRDANNEDSINDLLATAQKELEKPRGRRIAESIQLWKKKDELRDCFLQGFFPFKRKESLNLTGITFDRFHGGPAEAEWLSRKLAEKLVKEQDPAKFSRDPYLQLERYYYSIGDEEAAREIHYDGHCALRDNAMLPDEKSRVRWSSRKKATDLFLKETIGYGHKKLRLVGWTFSILILGTLLFWWSGLRANKLAVHSDAALKDERAKSFMQDHSLSDLFTGHAWPDLFYSFVYSLDLFIPVVDLGYATAWSLSGSQARYMQ